MRRERFAPGPVTEASAEGWQWRLREGRLNKVRGKLVVRDKRRVARTGRLQITLLEVLHHLAGTVPMAAEWMQ